MNWAKTPYTPENTAMDRVAVDEKDGALHCVESLIPAAYLPGQCDPLGYTWPGWAIQEAYTRGRLDERAEWLEGELDEYGGRLKTAQSIQGRIKEIRP